MCKCTSENLEILRCAIAHLRSGPSDHPGMTKRTQTTRRANHVAFRLSVVQSISEKYSDFPKTQITSIIHAVPPLRGAFRDRHGREAGCGGRGCAFDEWRRSGRRSRV